MYVSPRFRDIFSSGPIATRRRQARAEPERRERIPDEEFDRRVVELGVDLIWLQIAEAQRKAARSFMPGILRAGASTLPGFIEGDS